MHLKLKGSELKVDAPTMHLLFYVICAPVLTEGTEPKRNDFEDHNLRLSVRCQLKSGVNMWLLNETKSKMRVLVAD